jgi:hypothetical protein
MKPTIKLAICTAIAILLSPAAYGATGTIMPSPVQVVLDANGNPVASACVWTYTAGTSTAINTYTDVGLTVANANPIIANSAGRFTAYLTPGSSYKFIYENTPCNSGLHGSTIITADNIAATPVSAAAVDVVGTAGEAISAGNAVYLSDGSGSKVAGQWYKADTGNAYSSTLPKVGMAPSAITSGAAGTIRMSGSVTGLSSLSVSSTYYIGVSGAITSTAPALRRVLGTADSATSIILGDIAVPTQAWVNDFRLTLTTAVPVTTADVTGASAATIFCSPYVGNRIDLPDASGNPQRVTTAEISIAVPATTATMYDVFGFLNGSTATLELLAWTNDTTRATALVRTNGRLFKTGDLTRLYLGSVRTGAVSGQTEDSAAKRLLWNYYNRVRRQVVVKDATASWTYQTATYRQANGAAANQVAIVIGVVEAPIDLRLVSTVTNTGAAPGIIIAVAIGLDGVGGLVSGQTLVAGNAYTGLNTSLVASASTVPTTAGYHFYVWMEWSTASGTTTWVGTAAGAPFTTSGITGSFEG